MWCSPCPKSWPPSPIRTRNWCTEFCSERRPNLARRRRRSEAPRRGDRLLRRAPHLGQNLLHHPHLHCVIPDGGLSPDGARWISCRKGFFLPVAVLSCLFRRLFLEYLTAAFDAGKLKFFHTLEPLWERRAFLRTLAPLWNAKWVVHAKRPFAGPEQVLDYVGRYTHRVAVSNNRLESMDDANVSFRWKDYRDYNKQKTMTLTGEELIRRFLLHVVPRGFQRIRYYGFLANSCREQKPARCRELLANQKPPPPSDKPPAAEPTKDYRDQYQRLTGASLRECPACHHGHMIVIGAVTRPET